MYSPDPDYLQKVDYLCSCLGESARAPDEKVFVFLDEMGYYRWPSACKVWMPAPPQPIQVASCGESKNRQWRIIGVLNALTGQVNYLDNYIVGRHKVIEMYQYLDCVYDSAKEIYVAQDNWSIHKHPDVVAALEDLPKIQPVWLPTYSPWLNPIEKLWRWLRCDVLKMHRLASDWQQLRNRVNSFLNQFAHGSRQLLHYVGLLGDGRLAKAVRSP